MAQEKPVQSYCSQCEGDRRHTVQKAFDRRWDNEESGITGRDTWEILECMGCQNVTFVHTHWFSEYTDNTGRPIVHRDLYPPSPRRAKPDWAGDLWAAVPRKQQWLVKLYHDIYGALGLRALGLATMGMRAIVDFVVTSAVGDAIKGFKNKLDAMREQGLISELQVDVLYAAFDAGSAAAHRGYSPSREDANSLLDITESLLRRVYIDPMYERRHAKAAADLTERTPKRPSQ
jgi:uncharacterized protein DUF4145